MDTDVNQNSFNQHLVESLRISEISYRRLFETSRYGIIVLDAKTGKIINVNPYMTELLEYSRGECIGKELWEIGLFNDRQESLRVFRELQKNKYISLDELIFRTKFGNVLQAGLVGNIYTEESKRLIQLNIRDVRTGRRAEKQISLLNSELESQIHFFKSMLSAISDMTFVFDGEMRFLYANKPVLELYGKTLEEMIGKTFSDLGYPKDLTAKIRENLQQIFNTGEFVRDETEFPNAAGEIGFYEYILNPVLAPDGTVEAIIGASRDITQRRRAEEMIRKLNENLERSVARRTAELNAANKELEAFSYSVSHDLRAPLRAIDGFSRALLEDYAGQLDETAKEYLSRICAASGNMAKLINDLLNLSRLSRNAMRFESVNLSDLAYEITGKLVENEPDRLVEFSIEDGVVVTGSKSLLRIALQNLFDNAWKFTSKRKRAEIAFGQIRNGENIEYFVRDNGAGFDMGYADRLFGAFQRLHTPDEFEGTGIGLVTVRRIIHRHGGYIRAESKTGEGAAFYFTL